MKAFIKASLIFSVVVAGPVMAKPYHHALEPTVGVEVQMVASKPDSGFDFRNLLGVIIPGTGVEVHMGDLASAEEAAAAYDPHGVPETWHQVNPATGVERSMLR